VTYPIQPTSNDGLTKSQLAALEPNVRLIEAGPGAGKTKTVVARLRRQAAAGHNVALLSFTNAAIDVARARCRDDPELTQPPNFIGTFDGFFHRYVLTPALQRTKGTSPSYVNSWDDLPRHAAVVRPKSGGPGIRLSKFIQDGGGPWRPDADRLSRTEKNWWTEHSTSMARAEVISIASARLQRLREADIYNAEGARRQALAVLQAVDEPLLQRLRQRFHEVIVDEFQDCDEVEHGLLSTLHRAGISVVTVADPDQAIYEFRQTATGLYESYRARLKPHEIVHLSTCFRSTQAICSLVTSLRSVGQSPLLAGGRHKDDTTAIQVVVGTGAKAGSVALGIARQHGVAASRIRIIAHRRSDARSLSRASRAAPGGTSQMEPLLAALADLRGSTDARGRANALRTAESFVLDQFDYSASLEDAAAIDRLGRREQLEHLELSALRLRGTVVDLVEASKSWQTREECANGTRTVVNDLGVGLPIPVRPNLGRRTVVHEGLWKFWDAATSGFSVDLGSEQIRWGHIHGVKGAEFEAVVLAIPSTRHPDTGHVLDDWRDGVNTERRRVLYVGVSRAERLLILVISKSHREQLEELLITQDVPYVLKHA
jgi:DNA helicase-2/ATP-dependent DNA helicase PcrA